MYLSVIIFCLFGYSIQFKPCHNHKEKIRFLKENKIEPKKFSEEVLLAVKKIKSFDWREKTVLSPIRNQHLPQYCGSCWAFAAVSAITDRLIIKNNASTKTNVLYSNQYVVDCTDGSSCEGGYAESAYKLMRDKGIPPDTCSPYQAKDLVCNEINTCATCTNIGHCSIIKDFKILRIRGFGILDQISAIKAEIITDGPVTTALYVTANFVRTYTKGVYMGCEFGEPNHEVEIVGFGETVDKNNNTLPYWIIRNSWGVYFGENGYFKVPTSEYKVKKCDLNIGDRVSFPFL